MLNLRKRIKELQEKTSSVETKQICKEITENFVNVPDSQLASTLVEKLQKIEDADKHVERFVNISQKISDVTNLGVAKSLAELNDLRKQFKESQIYNYPALTYNLNKIESSLNLSKTPEYMLIDPMIECLRTFTWDPTIEAVYTLLKTNREKLDESITIAKNIFIMENMKGSFMYEGIISKLEEHFTNPTQSSRGSLIEDLKKFNFSSEARTLSESLKKLQGKNGSVQIIAENSKCEISPAFSPVVLHDGNEIMYIRGNFYSKKGNKINKLSEEVKSLPEKYVDLCRIVSLPNVFIKEGKISFFVKRDKVEILENESGIDVLFNGSKVPTGELAKHMVSAGMFRIDEAQTAYDVQKITESFKSIYELDFAKIIESRVYQGSYVILMKSDDNICLTKVNESNKSNEFFTDLNASKARNIILEFIGYDIKESLPEYIEKDELKLKELREQKIKLADSISIIESQITKLDLASNEPVLKDSPQVKTLKDILDKEITKLKNNYSKVSSDIKTFESTLSDAGYETGDTVKLKSNGELATVQSVNSSRKTLLVITNSGKSVEVSLNDIVSKEDEIVVSQEKNKEEDDKKKA